MRRRIVVALGGNALLRRGEPADAETQRRNVAVAARAVAEVAAEHDVVVTHGNGPQVGLLALQTEASAAAPPSPLDILGAESEGMIGYLLDQAVGNELPGRAVATLLTQVVVDSADPAFRAPTKPIGPVYGEAEAHRLARERGWHVARDGPHWRRVVPSPEPLRIVELGTIRLLVEAGVLVVCAGGGGVPVVAGSAGQLCGVEGVIDKDLAAALLARELDADMLLMLTDVSAVQAGWGTPDAHDVRVSTPRDVRALDLAAGSMGPKAEAAARFVETTGRRAAIGALADARAIVDGRAGTLVAPSDARDCASTPWAASDGAAGART